MDFLEYALGNADNRQQQMQQAELLRGAQQAKLAEALQQSQRFNNLQAVAPMLRNPALAASADTLAKQAQGQAPKMTADGAMLPSGEYIENPVRVQDRRDSRLASAQNMIAQQLAARERAQEANALRASLAAQANALRAQLAGDANNTRLLIAGMKGNDKEDAKATKAMNDNTIKLGKDLEKAGIPEFHQALSTVESTLGKFKQGELPGFGRMAGLVPSFMEDDQTQMVRSDMQAAANILLKSRSGAAVTESESVRFLQEVAAGKGMSEAALRNGWNNVRRNFNARVKNFSASYGSDVMDNYVGQGGLDLRKMPEPAPSPVKPSAAVAAPKPAKGGRLKFNPATGELE